ncbi:hypothetical protein Bca4012_092681 [Brassica carinata]
MEVIYALGDICGTKVSGNFTCPLCGNWRGSTSSEFEETDKEEGEDQAADTEIGENSHVAESVDGTADVSGRHKRKHAERGAESRNKKVFGKIETETTQLRTASDRTEQFETVVTDMLGKIVAEMSAMRLDDREIDLTSKDDPDHCLVVIQIGPSVLNDELAERIMFESKWLKNYGRNLRASAGSVMDMMLFYLNECIKPLERDGVDVMLLGGDWEWCLQKAESFVIRDVKVFSGGWTRIAEEGRLEGADEALALSSSSDDRSSNCLWKPKGSRSLSLMRLKRCLLRGNLYIGIFWRRYRMTFRHLRNCGESLRSSYSDEKTEEESTIDEGSGRSRRLRLSCLSKCGSNPNTTKPIQ